MIELEGKYYLYRHKIIETKNVFYIGIGTKKDSNGYKTKYFRAFTKGSRGKFWYNITKKHKYVVEIILESNDYDFIGKKEQEFIKLYGRRDLGLGTLVNLTDGGNGVSGSKNPHSEATKLKMSLAAKGKVKSKSHKENLSNSKLQKPTRYWKNKSFSEEHKNRLRMAKLGKPGALKGKPNLYMTNVNKKHFEVIENGITKNYFLSKKKLLLELHLAHKTYIKIINGSPLKNRNLIIKIVDGEEIL